MSEDHNDDRVSRRECVIVDGAGVRREHIPMIPEATVRVFLNGRPFATARCLSADLEDLAVGRLVSTGMLRAPDELREIAVSQDGAEVRVDGRVPKDRAPLDRHGAIPVSSPLEVEASAAIRIGCEFNERPGLYASTRCVHSAALVDGDDISCFREDVGRHNAVDKAIGAGFRAGLEMSRLVMLSSGRMPSDMISKIAAAGIPVVVTPAAATADGARLAEEAGIAICGRVARGRLTVYSCPGRIGGLS